MKKSTSKFIITFIILTFIISLTFVTLSNQNESKNNKVFDGLNKTEQSNIENKLLDNISPFLIPAQQFQLNPTIQYDTNYYKNYSFFQGFVIEGKNFIKTDENTTWYSIDIFPIPSMEEFYKEVGVKTESQNTVVIYPLFTSSAYAPNGFYDYYDNHCDQSCLTVNLQKSFTFPASGNGIQVLKLLGYNVITDLDFAKNPKIINEYKKIILLHNEYVTREMFDAITNHPKIIYLYPNALYAEVELNENESITLIKGHNFNGKNNGFDWKFDNSQIEYDTKCDNWKFYEVNNGVMLDCYPEQIILNDKKLLEFIKNF